MTKRIKLFAFAALIAAISMTLLLLGTALRVPVAEAQTSVLLPPVRTADALIQRRAISKIGGAVGSPAGVAWMFDELWEQGTSSTVPNGWNATLSGTAASLLATPSEGAGVHEGSSGATAASQATFTNTNRVWQRPDTVAFYFVARVKITTAVTAQTRVYTGLYNLAANKTIAVGFLGALHATNFIVQYDGLEAGSFVNLGVAADTAYHIFELWGVGDSKLHCAIDLGGADLCNVTMSAAPTDSCQIIRVVGNGTDAVNRAARWDYVAALAKRS